MGKLLSTFRAPPQPTYNINIESATGFAIGDKSNVSGNQFGLSPSTTEIEASRHLDVEIRKQAQRDCGKVQTAMLDDRSIVPVNLQIASKPVSVDSELDAEGHYRRRKDFMKIYKQRPGDLSEDQMFDLPKQQAKLEAEKMHFQTDDDKKDWIEREGNVIGIVGNPGIGKTTSLKKWVMRVVNGQLVANVSFIFCVFLKNIKFGKEMNVLEFLLSSVVPDWEHCTESDKFWLRKIFRDKNVLVALDGFDEIAVKDLTIRAPNINLFDKADPFHILLNLISSKLLPLARIVITSRPKQLYRLHSDHKPKYIFQILGLNRDGMDELGYQICSDRYEQIKGILLKNSDAFAFCYVPANYILILDYLMKNESDVENFLCMTQVLASACVTYSLSDHLHGKDCELDKLSKLAWIGYQKMQFTFEKEDLVQVDLDENTHASFLNTFVAKSTNIKLTMMSGQQQSYFSHLIWQEYFAALHLMIFATEEEFEEPLQHLFHDRWEVVTKFLFGLCNFNVYRSLKRIINANSLQKGNEQLWKKKKDKLKSSIACHLKQKQKVTDVGKPIGLDNLIPLFSWVHEANDEDITKSAVSFLPDCIHMKGTILPSDISNLFYTIGASPQVFTLEVEDGCKFTGDSLSRFWKAVAESKTKIRSFNLEEQSITDDDSSCIVESLQHVQELTLRNCGVSRNLVRALAEKWEEIGTNFMLLAIEEKMAIVCPCNVTVKGSGSQPFQLLAFSEMFKKDIEELNLSYNEKIDDEGFVILARLPGIRRLGLIGCDISSKGCAEFAEEMIKRNHKIEELNLSRNWIDDEAFVILARLPGIRRLKLWECDISSKGCAKFAEEIIKRNHKIEDLNLGRNWKIDDEAFVILARLPGIRRLKLWNCDISSKGCAEFVEEMIKRNHKLEYLDLRLNFRIGDDGARSLFRCFHLIEKLRLGGCDVTYAVEEETRSELRKLNLPASRVVF